MPRNNDADEFETHRPRLMSIAYRMLGSVAEAQDLVQEAYLRWHGAQLNMIENPGAFLSTVVTRLCLDHLKAVRHKREHYVGPWLPEPLITEDNHGSAETNSLDPLDMHYDPHAHQDLASNVSIALMLALERLSPLERAAFILHDIFDMGYSEVATSLGRSSVACRQLAARARTRVRENRPRTSIPPEKAWSLVHAFFSVSRQGDVATLRSLLAADVVLTADGGGQKQASLRPVFGQDRVSKFFGGLFNKAQRKSPSQHMPSWIKWVTINGAIGFISIEPDGTLQTTAIEADADLITAIYVTRNPDKLLHIAQLIPRGCFYT